MEIPKITGVVYETLPETNSLQFAPENGPFDAPKRKRWKYSFAIHFQMLLGLVSGRGFFPQMTPKWECGDTFSEAHHFSIYF